MLSVLLLMLTLPLPGLPVGGLGTSSIKVLRTTDSLRDFSGTTGLTLSPNTSALSRLAEVTVCLRYSLHQCLEFQPLFGNGDFVLYQSGSLPCPWPCTFSCTCTCIENGFYICTCISISSHTCTCICITNCTCTIAFSCSFSFHFPFPCSFPCTCSCCRGQGCKVDAPTPSGGD